MSNQSYELALQILSKRIDDLQQALTEQIKGVTDDVRELVKNGRIGKLENRLSKLETRMAIYFLLGWLSAMLGSKVPFISRFLGG